MKGRTYRFMDKEPLYPFGFGLTYTKFSLSEPRLSSIEIDQENSVELTSALTNTGNFEADQVVELYISAIDGPAGAPLYSLKGVKRVHLKPGESKLVNFTIDPSMLETIGENGNSKLLKGKYTVYLASSLPSERSLELGADKPVSAILDVK